MISVTGTQKKNLTFMRRSCLPRILISLTLATTVLAPTNQVLAGASLAIAPTRVVFEGRTRTASVGLINRGNEPAVFRISFQQKRMTAEGRIENIEKPDPDGPYADKMLRYSPRQITLPPGKTQVVRILLRKPPNLAEGEYRSHLLFREVPADSNKSINKTLSGEKNLSIRIIPVVGISIPVIVRHGKLDATSTLENLQLKRDPKQPGSAHLSLDISRKGNKSVFGDFTVYLKQGKKKLIVGKANGVAVYPPLSQRKFGLNIQAPKGFSLNKGELEVVYATPPAEGNEVLGTVTLSLANGS